MLTLTPLCLLALSAFFASHINGSLHEPNRPAVNLPFQTSPLKPHNGNGKSWFSRARNGIIRHIWQIPTEDALSKPNCRQSTTSQPPPTLLAQYGGDLVLRFEISSHEEAEALASAVNVLFLDVWEFTADWVDIRLSKDVVPSLLGLLPPSLQHAHTPLMHDLAQAIFESYPSLTLVDPSPPAQGPSRPFSHDLRPSTDETNIFFREYQPLSVIVPWMRLLRSLFPTHVRMLNIGYSYEGRDIPALRVGVHPTNSEKPSSPRKTIIITGGSHAREWISTSSVNYAAYSFITAYGKSKSMTKLLEEFDFIFVPTLNPDGYVYTWENDRLWRKNRQQTPLRFCKGLDLDRTYGFEWDSDSTKSNPCSESFSGEAPFEGVESRRFANWVHNETENNNVKVIGFLDLHSYSQQVLYPYSFSCTSAPPTLENLEEGAIGLAKAIRLTHGEIYGVTSACEGSVQVSPSAKCCQQRQQKSKTERALWPTIESGGGSALDWFYHELRVPYAYQIKLRDTGSYGFLLPAKNIVPTGKETFAAIEHFGQFLMGNKGIEVEEEEQLTEKISVQESNRNDMKPTTEDDWVVVDEPEEESMVGDKGLTGWELRRRKR